MKLSDYVADFMYHQGINEVFVVSGGASLHLIHSVADHPNMKHICPHHEQSAAMAADAYSRATGKLGAAIATSGPGATNLITGICSSYYDSVPTLIITGQVSTFRNKGTTGVRQIGFQETEIVDMVKSITNYAVQITDASRIRYELEKAVYLSRKGRPGPVLVDIPDNIQREKIDPEMLAGYTPEPQEIATEKPDLRLNEIISLISSAQRPVLVIGWGARMAGASDDIIKLATKLGFPVLLTWAVADILPANHPCYVGTFGTHGTRYANFTLQNADLVLSIGSRLDTKATGSPPSSFAREAKKIMVDIDVTEINKFKSLDVAIDIGIAVDAKQFTTALLKELPVLKKSDAWLKQVQEWRNKYSLANQNQLPTNLVNPYQFIDDLSESLPENAQIYLDTGCALAWFMQSYKPKKGQRVYHAFNNTPMGYALPAVLGGYYADPEKPIYAICGDGSFMMNIQEMTTILHYEIPVKIFVINNDGYAMIRQTQDQWLDNKYIASSPEGGVGMPNFVDVSRGFGFENILSLTKNDELRHSLEQISKSNGPVFCEVVVDAAERVMPQVKFGRPLEDAEPLLPRDEFLENMLVDPMAISKTA